MKIPEKIKPKRKRGWYAKAKAEFWNHVYEESDRERVMERCS